MAKKAPSRERYEEANPVITIRVPKHVRAELEEMREHARISWSELLQQAMSLVSPSPGA